MLSYRMETTIAQESALHLEALPFNPGDKVEITILKQTAPALPRKQRTVGEYAGRIRMADDFTAALPDDFWTGEPD
uniref:Uncharacterized protein n=1 Tax=Candidatus Kentrum sp. FM TaxID=2126340 RepID=A0A450SB90_9GAMM|nr:MAG: hypothetical protein BECKFM1743A_GA0114220_100271 [Candidatus Kentron sp. FM]VFJ49413.1 MAG: hypothetical protein BECKFM1743C_GA0114222_100711 [Candidatus Kentron sp. FM]VFK19443.1 MAG: hypothetical protein BECKFM1743B_GA0114221_106204 [Candidatus Kentron sp. FM]